MTVFEGHGTFSGPRDNQACTDSSMVCMLLYNQLICVWAGVSLLKAADLFVKTARLQGCCLGLQGCQVAYFGCMAGPCSSPAV